MATLKCTSAFHNCTSMIHTFVDVSWKFPILTLYAQYTYIDCKRYYGHDYWKHDICLYKWGWESLRWKHHFLVLNIAESMLLKHSCVSINTNGPNCWNTAVFESSRTFYRTNSALSPSRDLEKKLFVPSNQTRLTLPYLTTSDPTAFLKKHGLWNNWIFFVILSAAGALSAC